VWGCIISNGSPPRNHSEITDASGKAIGEVTSGAFSPYLKNISMEYVKLGTVKLEHN
jgi:glycine cleavage system aminomethyltransferase T